MALKSEETTAGSATKKNVILVAVAVACLGGAGYFIFSGPGESAGPKLNPEAAKAADELTKRLEDSKKEARKRAPDPEPEYSGPPGAGRQAVDANSPK